MEHEGLVCLNAQQRSPRHPGHLTIEFPHLDWIMFHTSGYVTIVDSINSVKDFAVSGGTLELHVFRVRPQERHCRISWTTKMQMLQRRIRTIPDLLRDQANTLREFLNCAEEWRRVTPGGDFVVTALAGQKRPGTPLSPTVVRSAIFSLAKAVMVVATPAGSIRGVHLDYRINYAQGILNDRIVRTANAITNQFEKTGIDDLFRRKFKPRARRLIREYQRPLIWVLI